MKVLKLVNYNKYFDSEGNLRPPGYAVKDVTKEKEVRLYKKQDVAVQKLKERIYNGIIWAPPGFGKTIIGIKAIQNLRRKNKNLRVSIIVANNTEMQWRDWLNHIGVSDKNILIKRNFKHRNWRKCNVFIDTYEGLKASLFRREDYVSDFFNCDLLIADEIHKLGSELSHMLLWKLCNYNIKHKIGLSATPHRIKYETSRAFINIFGGIIHGSFLDESEVKENLSKINLNVVKLNPLYDDNASEKISKLLKDIRPKKTIIFLPRKKIAQEIANNLSQNYNVFEVFANSKDKIEDFKEAKQGIMLTCSVGATGFDDSAVDCVMIAGSKSKIDVFQKIGRGIRKNKDRIKNIIILSDEFVFPHITIKIIESFNMDTFSLGGVKFFTFCSGELEEDLLIKNVYNKMCKEEKKEFSNPFELLQSLELILRPDHEGFQDFSRRKYGHSFPDLCNKFYLNFQKNKKWLKKYREDFPYTYEHFMGSAL